MRLPLRAPQGRAFRGGERAGTCAQPPVCARKYHIHPVQTGVLELPSPRRRRRGGAALAGRLGAVLGAGRLWPRCDGDRPRRSRTASLRARPLRRTARGVGDSCGRCGRCFGDPRLLAATAEGFQQPGRGLPLRPVPAAARRAAGEASFPGNISCRRSHLFLGLRPGLPGEITTPAGLRWH